jgi:hypothetical protein
MLIQTYKWHERQIISVRLVRAVKNKNITKSFIVKPRLSIGPEQTIQMALLIS